MKAAGTSFSPYRICALNARQVKGRGYVPVEDDVFFDVPLMLWLLRHGFLWPVKTGVPLLAFIDLTVDH